MANKPKPIIIVSGAQYGSESKGSVAAALCERRKVDYAVRTGAVNAGHSVYYRGKKYVNQQLPTGWVANSTLVIGPGALIHPEIFLTEVTMVREAGFTGDILVDRRAGVHLGHHSLEGQSSDKHYRIGATGKGCSFALVDRVQRNPESKLFRDVVLRPELPLGWEWADTVQVLNNAYDNGEQILLEGTQGTLLDLYLGPYPYTTHKQCTAAQWVVEAGLSPSLDYEIVLVARTYPIRVAGNSGPMPQEINWPQLTREINQKLTSAGKDWLVDEFAVEEFLRAKNSFPESRYKDHNVWLSESNRDALNSCTPGTRAELAKLWEFTTVTKKLRRVARLDIDSLKYSVMVNRPAWLAVTFLNYEFPEIWGSESALPGYAAHEYLLGLENDTGVPVRAFTTGPESRHFIDWEREAPPLSSSTSA